MNEHYYSEKPSVESRELELEVSLRGQKLRFITDRGVFSKGGVDYGTQLLLESIVIKEASSILDLGCGYGPIGITLAKENPASKLIMLDINERAVQLAEKNARLNGVNNVQIKQSNLFSALKQDTFSLIVSNPPIRAGKQVVHQLFTESFQHLEPGGELWIVIQKKQGAASAFVKLTETFEKVEEVTKKKGYRIIRAIKA